MGERYTAAEHPVGQRPEAPRFGYLSKELRDRALAAITFDFPEYPRSEKARMGPASSGRMLPSSDFQVEVGWADVLALVATFAWHGNAEARRMVAALKPESL
jgi:hypothetical protein